MWNRWRKKQERIQLEKKKIRKMLKKLAANWPVTIFTTDNKTKSFLNHHSSRVYMLVHKSHLKIITTSEREREREHTLKKTRNQKVNEINLQVTNENWKALSIDIYLKTISAVPGCKGKSFFFTSFITSTISFTSLCCLACNCIHETSIFSPSLHKLEDKTKTKSKNTCVPTDDAQSQCQESTPISYSSTVPSYLFANNILNIPKWKK